MRPHPWGEWVRARAWLWHCCGTFWEFLLPPARGSPSGPAGAAAAKAEPREAPLCAPRTVPIDSALSSPGRPRSSTPPLRGHPLTTRPRDTTGSVRPVPGSARPVPIPSSAPSIPIPVPIPSPLSALPGSAQYGRAAQRPDPNAGPDRGPGPGPPLRAPPPRARPAPRIKGPRGRPPPFRFAPFRRAPPLAPAMAKDQLKPRLCHMLKGENGYGFHLHGEKGKSGQFIRKVEPGSPAEAAGLRAGDRVVEVNGLNVEQETHHQVRGCGSGKGGGGVGGVRGSPPSPEAELPSRRAGITPDPIGASRSSAVSGVPDRVGDPTQVSACLEFLQPGTPRSHENGRVPAAGGCCNRGSQESEVGELKVFWHGQGTAVLCNLRRKGIGRPGLYFRLCSVLFSATLGKLLQPGLGKDASKSTDRALQMFSGLSG